MMNYLLKGILIFLPFMTYAFIGKPILTSQAVLSIALEILVILLFVFGIWNKRIPDLKAPVLFFAYILFSSGWVIVNRLLLDDEVSAILRPLLHVSIFFLFYFALCYILNEETYKNISKVVIYPAVILSTICIFQKFGIDMFKYSESWINGSLGNPTNNAMYLCACLPFTFLHKRPFVPIVFLFCGMLVCWSASALISAVIIIFIYLLIKRKYLPSFLFVLTLSVFAFIYKDQLVGFFSSCERLFIWQKAIEHWKERYLFGWGIDSFKHLHLAYNSSSIIFTQNHYIWMLHSCGLAGLVFFVNWMRSLKFVFDPADIRFLATLSLVSIAAMACVSIPMRVYSIVILTAFNLAIMTKERVK